MNDDLLKDINTMSEYCRKHLCNSKCQYFKKDTNRLVMTTTQCAAIYILERYDIFDINKLEQLNIDQLDKYLSMCCDVLDCDKCDGHCIPNKTRRLCEDSRFIIKKKED